jgi:hypothetical protein
MDIITIQKMIKLYFRIIQGITFLYLSTLGIMWGQTHLYNNTKVDSITFVNTRKALNNLSTDNYQKKVFSYKDKELPYRFLLPQNVDNKRNTLWLLHFIIHPELVTIMKTS